MDLDAREHARAQWSMNPCGATGGTPGTVEYFREVERLRFQQQAWTRAYFNYPQFVGKRVLEIGVGQGTDLVQFAGGGADCHGVDITERHLELAGQNFLLRGLPVVLRNADATALPYPPDSFDCVYSFGVLHHIPEPDRVIAEVKRVLKPGGVLMFAVYHRWSWFFGASILLSQGLLHGRLFRLGWHGLLSTIEFGADGRSVCPYVKLYSRRMVRALCAGLQVVDVSVHQMSGPTIGPRWVRRSFRGLGARLEPWLGWYVAAKAIKPMNLAAIRVHDP